MFYFLYGDDTYSINKKVKELEDSFLTIDTSGINICKLGGKDLSKNAFLGEISVMPFLSEKRFLIIRNLLLENTDKELQSYIQNKFESLPANIEVVLYEEGVPDGRNALFKTLKGHKNSLVFNPPSELQLNKLISERIKEAGLTISREAVIKLGVSVGPDLWRLENEISKMILFAKSQGKKEITPSDIELMVESDDKINIFNLTDAIGEKNHKRATTILHDFLNRGEDEIYLFNMLVGQIRKMLIIQDLSDKKMSASVSAFHPFVIQKITRSLQQFKSAELKKIYFKLQDYDRKIKTGLIEPKIALDQLVVEFCKVC